MGAASPHKKSPAMGNSRAQAWPSLTLSLRLSLSLSLSLVPPASAAAALLLSFERSFVWRKQRNSMPVARRASASVFLTPSRCAWRFSSPGRFAYAREISVYRFESVLSAEGVTYRESVWCMNSISSVACCEERTGVGKGRGYAVSTGEQGEIERRGEGGDVRGACLPCRNA